MSIGATTHNHDSGEFKFDNVSSTANRVSSENEFLQRLSKLQDKNDLNDFVIECSRLITYLQDKPESIQINLDQVFFDLRRTIRFLHTITGEASGLKQSESAFIKIFFRDVKTNSEAYQYNAFLHLSEAYCKVLPTPLDQARLDLIRAEISLEIGDPAVSEEMFLSALRGMRDQNNEYLASHREEAMQYLIRFGEVNYFLGRYKDAVECYQSAIDLSTTHAIPITEVDAEIIMSHYAFAYAVPKADSPVTSYNNIFLQSPPYVEPNPETLAVHGNNLEKVSQAISNRFLIIGYIGVANAALDQGEQVPSGMGIISESENQDNLDIAIRKRAVKIRLNTANQDGADFEGNGPELPDMLRKLSEIQHFKETFADTEVEVGYAILEASLTELTKLNNQEDKNVDQQSNARKIKIANAFNLAKQSFEKLYSSSIRASGFDYSYQVVRMYANLFYEFRRLPDDLKEYFRLSMPISESKVLTNLNCLSNVLSHDIIKRVADKLL